MKNPILRLSLTTAAVATALCGPVAAEDIDLFTGTNATATNPNVVIMIDNSANWNANNQHWPGVKQGQAELRALAKAVGEVSAGSINMGLMLFTPGVGSTPNGAYVRFHVRTLDATNKLRLQQQIGMDGSGNSICDNANNLLTGSPNCMFQNFSSSSEQVGTAKLDYSAGLFEVFKYFGGFTDPAHAINDSPGGPSGYSGETPLDASHFGPYRYARNGGSAEPNSDPAAYNGGSLTGYNTPFNPDGTGSCARNYLIFIGNGFPNQDSAATLLTGVNGNATQLKMPQFTTITNNVATALGNDASCRTQAACATQAATTFPDYDSYTCTGGIASPDTVLGTDTVCESATACATRAATLFPGYTSYYCIGGTSAAPATVTDNVCRTPAACAAAGPTLLPGYSAYSCAGGTSTTGTITLGTDPVTESVAACKARAATLFPGFATYDCTGGTLGTPIVTTFNSPTCETPAICLTNAPTRFPGHDAYVSCTGGATAPGCGGARRVNQLVTVSNTPRSGMTMTGTSCAGGRLYGQTLSGTSACLSGQTMKATDSCIANQVITGFKLVNTVTGTGTFDFPAANKARNSDEWAKYLFSTDANAVSGQQNITTYTIDVFKDAQDADQTALLLSMAKYGGGRYFQATSEDAILNALREILTEIQSVNTVFASASLPINATNRSQNENQVFIGMFRPDNGGRPKWYGNLKHYQVALFGGDARLADSLGKEAIAATTGFIQACAQSFYTSDSDVVGPPRLQYWDFSPISAGRCTSLPNNTFNDLPDGGVVEKGGAAEVLRRGNDPAAPTLAVNRSMLTCATAPCSALTPFDEAAVPIGRTNALNATEHTRIVEFTKGKDWGDENNNSVVDETRPTMHGDIAHSRPLPVNFGGTRGVEVYYGSNDGAFHAMRGSDGKELWSFIAPEHHSKLKRLYDNSPVIAYPGIGAGSLPKDYFFDGSAGLYQTAMDDPTPKVWIYPTMRRGGRMLYAFDISTSGTPAFKWAIGCPNLGNDTDCGDFAEMGQTWSVPNAAFISGYPLAGAIKDPVVIVGGGYDRCEDSDQAATTCTSASKGHRVYVVDADSGAKIAEFETEGSVPADITLIDRDFDGKVDHGYVLDTRGNLYRIDFVDPVTLAPRGPGAWTITKIARTQSANRKFLFGPAALSTGPVTYLSFGSGDRERPLITNYPYTTPMQNRFYMFTDKFQTTGLPVDLDGSTMTDNSNETTCADNFDVTKSGWFMDLRAGTGEQTVTSSVIFGGTVFFSTNRPIPTAENSCATNLGEARGYAVNLLNASGVIGTGKLCGGDRSGVFTGGGLPPSPVVGTVPVLQADGTTRPISVLIGGINLDTGTGSPIGAQQPPVPIKQIRSRVYWYRHGDR